MFRLVILIERDREPSGDKLPTIVRWIVAGIVAIGLAFVITLRVLGVL